MNFFSFSYGVAPLAPYDDDMNGWLLNSAGPLGEINRAFDQRFVGRLDRRQRFSRRERFI